MWLHSPVVGAGRSKKLHCPWTGRYRILKRLSEQVYRVQSTSGDKKRLVVHFNRLKPYRTHGPEESGDSPESPITAPSNTQLHNFGEQLQVTEGNPPAVTLPPPPLTTPRYPRRERAHLTGLVTHFFTECGTHATRGGVVSLDSRGIPTHMHTHKCSACVCNSCNLYCINLCSSVLYSMTSLTPILCVVCTPSSLASVVYGVLMA